MAMKRGPMAGSANAEYLEQFNDAGFQLPTCVNDGCNFDVRVRNWKGVTPFRKSRKFFLADHFPEMASECSSCERARKFSKPIEGIVPHKKNYCENKDQHLGFDCPTKRSAYKNLPGAAYDMDHIDGNHLNNSPKNVETLCKTCHVIKTKNENENGKLSTWKTAA